MHGRIIFIRLVVAVTSKTESARRAARNYGVLHAGEASHWRQWHVATVLKDFAARRRRRHRTEESVIVGAALVGAQVLVLGDDAGRAIEALQHVSAVAL